MTREDEKQYKGENSIMSKFRLSGYNASITQLFVKRSLWTLNQITKQKSHFSNRMKNSFISVERGFKIGGGGEGGNGTYVE